MGFHFGGAVINKSFKDNPIEALKAIGIHYVEFVEEVSSDVAMSWGSNDTFYVLPVGSGTIIFMGLDYWQESFKGPGIEVMTWAIEETSMSFVLNYSIDNRIIRKRTNYNYEYDQAEGEPLPIESKDEHLDEVIRLKMQEMLGRSFWSIEPDEVTYRFRIDKKKKQDALEQERLATEKRRLEDKRKRDERDERQRIESLERMKIRLKKENEIKEAIFIIDQFWKVSKEELDEHHMLEAKNALSVLEKYNYYKNNTTEELINIGNNLRFSDSKVLNRIELEFARMYMEAIKERGFFFEGTYRRLKQMISKNEDTWQDGVESQTLESLQPRKVNKNPWWKFWKSAEDEKKLY